MIHNTCEETLGSSLIKVIPRLNFHTDDKKVQKKGAINCSRTRKEKATAQTEYNKAHKEVRQSVRKDRRTYIENLAPQAEEAANMRNYERSI
jgi:hypothetical protein